MINYAPPPNHAPDARRDDYLYLDYSNTSEAVFPVLENDSDPDGDPIRISQVDMPASGEIVSYSNSTVTYSIENPNFEDLDSDFFTYTITDELLESGPAFVHVHFCYCPIQCVDVFLGGSPVTHIPGESLPVRSAGEDSLDIDLFRQLRDDILLPDSTGATFVDLYYNFAPEIMPLLVQHREDIGMQAFHALSLMQDPVRNLLEKDGSSVITQELVDSVTVFLDSLLSASSDTLRIALDSALAKLCPFDEMVGMTAAEAVEFIGCDTMSTAIENPEGSSVITSLGQNFPNPFGSGGGHAGATRTEVHFFLASNTLVRIQVFDIYGNLVKTLVDDRLPPGEHIASWDGRSEAGNLLPAGVYFYRLNTDSFKDTRQMIIAH